MNTVEYPCGVCGKDVECGTKAIQCESDCMLWFHAQCIHLTDDEYEALTDSDSIWECTSCRNSELPDLNSKDTVDTFHFDFQQNMPTPKLTVGVQFYLRLLWTYLFGIYSASVQMTTAFMWHELLARRGCDNVISCLNRFIFHTALGRTGAKWSIWWADNCPGQNKNNYIMWYFQDLIRRNVYTRIDYKFLIAGHTYGSTDQTFGMIERHASRIDTVYTPEQWYQHVREAGACLQVVEMKQAFFRNYRQHLRSMYTERNKDEEKQTLDFQKIVWFNFGKGEIERDGKLVPVDHPKVVWVRYTYNVKEQPRHVCYYKKRNLTVLDTPPPPLYSHYPIPIKKAKAADVKTLVNKYLPLEHRYFYDDMPIMDSDADESLDEDM